MNLAREHRDLSVVIAIVVFGLVLAAIAPAFYSRQNLLDLFLASMPVLIVALGATLVILTGHIDISVGSTFAVSGIVAGICATSGLAVVVSVVVACAAGALVGAVNGALVAYVRIPSIVVTLASMVALRDALRWMTQGAWISGLPPGFQWLGFSQSSYPIVAASVACGLTAALAWGLRYVAAGRAVYATGSNREAARLAGIDTARVVFTTFSAAGALTGLAAVLNAVRFNQIPSNAGLGLEMKVVAAVVVGGAAITGGKGHIIGTVLGVTLLAAIGPALTFAGVSPYWERALQGAIVLSAVAIDAR